MNNLISDEKKLETIAHELFHAYQHDHGGYYQIPNLVEREVEAELFAQHIMDDFTKGAYMPLFGNFSEDGAEYERITSDIVENYFDRYVPSYIFQHNFRKAVNLFKLQTS